MNSEQLTEIIRTELNHLGTNAYRFAIDSGLPNDAIRYVLEGRQPKLDRLVEICNALGLEFYIGPNRASTEDKNLNQSQVKSENPTLKVADVAVKDCRLSEIISLLAAEWEACDARGQDHLATRFHAYFPELGDKPTNRRCHE